MPLVKLSCVNCSAPLDISDDLERFACSYCGTNQVVERSGGIVALRRMEEAIGAVQRGTDRTAAELALPRLKKELADAYAAKAEALTRANAKHVRAGNGRRYLTAIAFFIIFFVGLGLASDVFSEIPAPWPHVYVVAWMVLTVTIPAFIFWKVKIPTDSTAEATAPYNEAIARIERQMAAQRAILDA